MPWARGWAGSRQRTDSRRVQHRAVDEVSVGVGAIQDDQGQSLFGAGLHHQDEGGQVGVAADPDVLDVEDHGLQPVELGSRRLLVCRRGCRRGCPCAGPVRRRLAPSGKSPAEPVLRSKGGGHIDAEAMSVSMRWVNAGCAVGEGGRVVADDADAPAFEEGR